MAAETMSKEEELEKELNSIREEYVRLQDHLADTELRYQSALANETDGAADSQFSTELQTIVANLFNCERYSDVQVLLEHGRLFFGHKIILAARSIYWGVADLSLAPTIDLKTVNYDVAMAMLKWVYTDEINLEEVNNDFLIELLRVTTKYHLESLFTRCQNMLISKINEENCQFFYRVGNELSSTTLRNHCLEYMTRGKDGVVIVTDDPTSDSPIKTSSDTQLDCDVCHRHFKCNAKLKRHLLTHTGEKPFKCDLCNKALSDKVCLKKHMLTQHSEALPQVEYICSICCRPLSTVEDLQSHEKLHLLDPIDRVCKFCFVKFPSSSQLKRHMLTHTKQKPFSCSECSKGFSSKYSLEEHIRRLHKDLEKTVPQRRKNVKKTLEIFECDMCSIKFKSEKKMKTHRLMHTGENPFKCDICQKTFHRKNNLKYHLKIHEGKNAKCEICGKCFVLDYQLRLHKRIHTGATPYKCQLCDRAFRYRESMVVHMRIHRNERPFKCDVCGTAFRTQWQIKRHQRTHTGEKPYLCTICKKRFNSPSILQRHEVNIHKTSCATGNSTHNTTSSKNKLLVKIEKTVMAQTCDSNVISPSSEAAMSGQAMAGDCADPPQHQTYATIPFKRAEHGEQVRIQTEKTEMPVEVSLVENCGEVVIQIPSTEISQFQLSYPTIPFQIEGNCSEVQVQTANHFRQGVAEVSDSDREILEQVSQISYSTIPFRMEEECAEEQVQTIESDKNSVLTVADVSQHDSKQDMLEQANEICDFVVPVVSEENQLDAIVQSVAENDQINAIVRASQNNSEEPQTIIVIQTD